MNYSSNNATANTQSLASPYRLDSTGQNSDTFYILLDLFTEKVLKLGREWLGEIIINYRHSAHFLQNKFQQSADENLLDLLIVGVLWNEYKGQWGKNIKLGAVLLNKLYQLRKLPILKKISDNARGHLGHYLLNNQPNQNVPLNFKNLQRLTWWLSSTNEFNEEVLRINTWNKFVATHSEVNQQAIFHKLIEFAKWFQTEASMALHDYTRNVEPFLKNHCNSYRKKEDYFFTGRSEVEYHLNMLGAAIMNKNMRNDFLETCCQILLLPACMAKNKKCRATETQNGYTCTHCSPDCNVSIVTKSMRLEGIQTIIAYHSIDFSKTLKNWAKQKHTGLIGTACTLNLLSGGFEMKRLHIPGQCVFLDYCGCKKHWNQNGVPTNINIQQIKKVVRKPFLNAI